jgi:hypothetical protein
MDFATRLKINTTFKELKAKVEESNASAYEKRRLLLILKMKKKNIENQVIKKEIDSNNIANIFQSICEQNRQNFSHLNIGHAQD